MRATPATLPSRRKSVGTRHDGPLWTQAVRDLRRAAKNAVRLASWRPDCTPDSVGIGIIETSDQLHPGSLHVLALVNSILVRASKS